MPDWPRITSFPQAALVTVGPGSQVTDIAEAGGVGLAAGSYPAANRAIYCPITVSERLTAYQIAWLNGSTVSGNVDAGIYDVNGSRLVSTGSTAQSGVSVIQTVDITDTVLIPGVYFLAIAIDNTTATLNRLSTNLEVLRACGVQQQATAFTLPSTATFAAPASSYFPVIGASVTAVL